MNNNATHSLDNDTLQEIWRNLGEGNRNKKAFESAINRIFGPWSELNLYSVSGGGWNISGKQHGKREEILISFTPSL